MTEIDRIADSYVDEFAALDPTMATIFGIEGHDTELADYSADGYAARADLARHTVAEVDAALARAVEPSPRERLAAAQITERLGRDIALYDAGGQDADLNSIDSPLQLIRMVFDLMPTDTQGDWDTVAARLEVLPAALARYSAALLDAARRGHCAAQRQVSVCADQCGRWAGGPGEPGFFAELVGRSGVDGSLAGRLREGALRADAAYGEFGTFLRRELAPFAPARDAVGRERYQLALFGFTGARLDLDETYAWGWEELARLLAEQRAVAAQIVAGGTVADAIVALDADPARRLDGADALKAWMQETSDRAVAELNGAHFDIPEPIQRLECLIAPPGGAAGMYYTGPSEDFSRPGRMWWSIPDGETSFTTWREKTTVYHEGVPGHHLQIALTAYRSDLLNRFQRVMGQGVGYSGYCEGWALYAERLMADLGYLDDPGDRLGMLDSQILRAARVVLDIGMHLELPIPAGAGFHEGERWNAALGVEFLDLVTSSTAGFVRDEIDRYLGWPGQAPAYKVGERVWLAARKDAERGAGFDLKAFHRAALDLGPLGLDQLSGAVASPVA